MKKLMVATLTALSLLLPNKLNSLDTTEKKPETKVFVNVLTGETLRARVEDGSYWSWMNPKLSEWLDSAAIEIEKTKTSADTFYIPKLHRNDSSPEGVEIPYSPFVDEMLKKLGYSGEGSWGKVGKKLITAWKQNNGYDTTYIMTFKDAIGGSSICLPYAAVMYTLMKNKGVNPLYFEIHNGWFRSDTIILARGMFYTGHSAIYFEDRVYDNEAAYPAGEGTVKGHVPARGYLDCFRILDCSPEAEKQGWKSGLFLLTFRERPWNVTIVTIQDTNHPFYGWDGVIIDGLKQKNAGRYTIVYAPELKDMVKEMSSGRK